MKRIITILASAIALVSLFSCETYKVAEPEMSAVAAIDGKYVAFGAVNGTNVTVFGVQITNTTKDEANRAWMTITDLDALSRYPSIVAKFGAEDAAALYYQLLFAVRFEIQVDPVNNTFSATSVSAAEPRTTWNPYLEGLAGQGGYYTFGYRVGAESHTVSVNGRVIPGGITTPSGNKADKIEFTYSISFEDGTVEEYTVSGIKKTGWGEDTQEYADFCDENLW